MEGSECAARLWPLALLCFLLWFSLAMLCTARFACCVLCRSTSCSACFACFDHHFYSAAVVAVGLIFFLTRTFRHGMGGGTGKNECAAAVAAAVAEVAATAAPSSMFSFLRFSRFQRPLLHALCHWSLSITFGRFWSLLVALGQFLFAFDHFLVTCDPFIWSVLTSFWSHLVAFSGFW